MNDTTRLDRTSRAGRRPAGLDADQALAVLDQERRMVSEAILLVSMGRSPRVTVAGLHCSDEILEASRPLAATHRVRLVSLWTDDERGGDIAVEAIEAPATMDRVRRAQPIPTAIPVRAAARGGA